MRIHGQSKKVYPDLAFEYHSEAIRSLVAVQGPKAQHVLEHVLDDKPNLKNLGFMESTQDLKFKHDDIIVTRCGYTGEDGFEVSLPNSQVEAFMDKIWTVKDDKNVQIARPVGLGARDSLRLEAGLCLYGHELSEDISPVKAMLMWTLSKRRKEQLGFLGDEMVKIQMEKGVKRKRCGFIGDKTPIREGTQLFEKNPDGSAGDYLGEVTSGTVTPSVGKAVGMAYVRVPNNKVGTSLIAVVRGKNHEVKIAKMPFWPTNYYRKP